MEESLATKNAKNTKEEAEILRLCDTIRQTAYDLHEYLGVGYLEKVYENGLAHRLKNLGLNVKRQYPITVMDEDGFVLGDYVADLVVEEVVVELKSVATLLPIHFAQCLNYLKAMRLKHGLVINFGSEKFQCKKMLQRHI